MILECYNKTRSGIEFGKVWDLKGPIYEQPSGGCSRKARNEAHFRTPFPKDIDGVLFLERLVESRYFGKEI